MNKKLMAVAALGSAGLDSLGLAAGLTRYRSLFLGLTGALLAVAFYFVYRKRSAACAA